MKHTNTQDHNTDFNSIQSTEKEASLLAIIQENSRLPEIEQARYQQLLHKYEDKTINDDEIAEYQTLLCQLDTRNLKRIDALMALAQIKGNVLGNCSQNHPKSNRTILPLIFRTQLFCWHTLFQNFLKVNI